MASFRRISLTALAAGLATLGFLATETRAQVKVNPHVGNHPSASTRIGGAQAAYSQATRVGTQPFLGGYNRGVGVGRVGGVGGVGGGYYGGGYGYPQMTPGYGYLSGASEVINSQAQFMLSQQEADLKKEQVKQAKLDTSRKTWDEWKYEQSIMPTAEEQRLKREKAEVDRARGNPPSIDVWSGDAMNTLLTDIQKLQGAGTPGPNVPLPTEVVKQLNLTDGRSPGPGLLRDGGALTWPYSLENEVFQADRKRMDGLMAQAVGQARSGKRVEPKIIRDLQTTEDSLRAQLKSSIHDLTPTQGVEARRYLNDLHDTARTLQDPNVSKYFGGQWSAKGNSVAELVDEMTRQGLKFAPATDGDQAAYTAVYKAMVSYDRALTPYVSRAPSSSPPTPPPSRN